MGIRVLVVDDDKDLLTLIERFLVKEQPDFEVVSTISAQDAVRKLEEEHFDAIVCDYYLGVGEMNGLELLEWLRASQSTIPFIMFTGRSREEVAIRALNLGADLYLKKDQEDLGNLFAELVHHIKSSVESVQIEKTLWEERSRFQKYLDVAGVMIVALDSDGRVTLMNHKGCEILGYGYKEVIGKDWFKTFLPKRFRKETYDVFRNLMKGKVEPVAHFENPVLNKDGEERIIAWHNSVLTDESGKIVGILSSGEDITDRRKAEEALRDSESMFRSLFEQAPMGVARVDLDGTILQGNSSLALMLGYDIDELVGINVFEISIPEDEKVERRLSQELLQGIRDSYEMEKRFIRKDGEEIWGILSVSVVSNSRGEPIFTIGMVENITPRKKAEEALRVSERRFRTIFEQAVVGVTIVELDDNVIEANPFFQELIGYSADELVTMKVADFTHPDDAAIDTSLTREVLDGKRDSYTMEKRYIRKTGEEIWGKLSANFATDEQGIPEFCIGIIEDITERKKAEEKLRESEERLELATTGADHGIWDWNMQTGELTFNEILREMFGIEKGYNPSYDEVQQRIHPDDLQRFLEIQKQAMTAEGKMLSAEFQVRTRSRDWIWVLISGRVVEWSENGEPVRAAGLTRNVTDQKTADAALESSEKRYRKLVEESLQGIAIFQDEKIAFANPAYAMILGRSVEELLALSQEETWALVHPDDIKVLKQRNKMAKDYIGNLPAHEFRYMRPDGEVRWVEAHANIIENNGKPAIQSLEADITEKLHAENELRESEERYRTLYENLSDALIRTDTKGFITFCNAQIAELFQYADEEVIGVNFNELLHPDDRERIASTFAYALETEETSPEGHKVRGIRKDGSFIHLHAKSTILIEDGKPSGFQCLIRDITTLKESEERYRGIFDNVLVGLVRTRIDDGRVLFCNDVFAHTFGYETQEEAIHNYVSAEHYTDPEARQRGLEELRKTGEIHSFLAEMTKCDGTIIWTEYSATMNKEKGYIDVVLMDATERVRAEKALKDSEERMTALFNGIPVPTYTWKKTSDDFILSDYNYAADELSKGNMSKVLGAKLSEYYSDRLDLQEAISKVYNEKIALEQEIELTFGTTGEHKHLDVKYTYVPPDMILVHTEDMTEKKQAEADLKFERERFISVLDALEDGIYVVNRNYDIEYTNQVIEREFGPVAERKCYTYLHDRKEPCPRCQNEEVFAGNSVRWEWYSKKNDRYYDLLDTPIKNADGSISKFEIFRDITENKAAEKALRESEERYRVLVETMNDGLGAIDENKRFTFVNNSFAEMLGYSPEEMIGQLAADFVDEKNLNVLSEHIEKRREGLPSAYELTWTTKTGEEVISIVSGSPFLDKDGNYQGSFAVITDITERKSMDDALRESEQRNRIIVDAMSDLVLVFDSEGRYCDYFAKDDSLLVRPWDEVNGRKHEEIIPPGLAAQYNEYGKRVRENGESITFEYELEIGSTLRWFQGTMMLHEDEEHIVYAVKDITGRKLVEENLRQSEKKYHSIFDNTPVGLTFQEIVVDESGNPIDFVFIDVNEGFEALMGLRKDDIIGKSASHVLTSNGKPTLEWIDVYGKVALTGARARFDQYSEALGRWFSVTAYSPEKNFFITSYTDITEQKKAYDGLKQQKKELSDFAHMMSHDLNSYFFKIRGSILLLGTKDEFPEIRGIRLLTEEMIDLVQHSVALADAGLVIDKKHKVNLGHLVRDVAVRHLPEGVALMQGQLQSVLADEIKLIQIFQNLFDNAVEHGNPTTVEVQRYDSKEGVRIVVINNGKPIPTDSRPKVFQRGFTTKDKRKGYGLSIVKKLVEAHGWQIKLADTPETAFEILIPSAAV